MNPNGRALFRWSGRALVDQTEREWSLILKAWRRDPKTDAAEQWTHWKREFLAYSSGILDDLPGISAPASSVRRMKATSHSYGSRKSLKRPRVAGQRTGTHSRLYILGDSTARTSPADLFPTHLSLRGPTSGPGQTGSRGRIRFALPTRGLTGWSRRLSPRRRSSAWSACTRWSRSSSIGWRRCRRVLSPRCLARESHRRGLSDWRRLHDRDRLVLRRTGARRPGGRDPRWRKPHLAGCRSRQLATMSRRTFTAYVEGLGEAGWRGDERVVRFAYAASAALYMVPPLPLWLRRIADPARREWIECKCRRDAVEIVRGWALMLDHLLALAGEAYALAERLDDQH